MQLSLIVNAGGKSRRMGQDKALLRLPHSGETLLAHIVARLMPLLKDPTDTHRAGRGRVVIVSSLPQIRVRAGLPGWVQVVEDEWPEGGALGGIITGLRCVSGWAMCVACDMPFVSVPVMQRLLEEVNPLTHAIEAQIGSQIGLQVDAVLAHVHGRIQPFHALYHPRLQSHLIAALESGELSIHRALLTARLAIVEEADLRPLDPHLQSFQNINTPADWAQAQAWWASSDGREESGQS